MKILLDLNQHCIQTAVKRKYNQLISIYFKSNRTENKKTVEAEISLLKQALENLDFAWLRATYPELRGGGPEEIEISSGTDNNITILINGRTSSCDKSESRNTIDNPRKAAISETRWRAGC